LLIARIDRLIQMSAYAAAVSVIGRRFSYRLPLHLSDDEEVLNRTGHLCSG
jgi:hypothetical protein